MQQQYQCSNCGAPVGYGARFCGKCGTQLNWPMQPTPYQPPQQPAQTAQYQPQYQQPQQTAQPLRYKPQMNWFERHLNWTWVLGFIVISFVLGLIFGFFMGLVDPYGLSDDAQTGISYLIAFLVAFILGGWVLRQKRRSLWWLLIILVPFGWIVFLCLENRS